jgi:hypothetical protein
MKYNNFYYALTLLKTIYGLSISEDDFEEIALIGWDLIGNKRARYYKYSTSVDPQTNSITLPCNADILKAVTTDFEEWDRVTGDFPNGNLNSSFVESYIEGHKKFTHP